MSNTIRLKRRATGGAAGAPAALKTTEPAYNEVDDVLYLGKGDDGSGNATTIAPVGGKGAFADLSTTQTIGGTKTFGNSPLVPNVTAGDSTNKAANTNFVQNAISAASIPDGDKGDIIVSGSGSSWTIDTNVVSNAKAAQMATKTYKGRTSAGTGNSEDVPVATLKSDLALTKSDVGLANVDNTSDAAKNAAAATLTNKTLTAPVINSPTGIVKGDVGLGNVDNTSDASKPVSTAQQTALDLKAPLASPTFTGPVNVPTAAQGTNSTIAASCAFVITEIAAKIAAVDAQIIKGGIDCSANPNYPAADAGWTYRVTAAGKIGGASGAVVEVGDVLICFVDSTAAGTQAAVGANWIVLQTNIDGAVTMTGTQTLTNKTLTAPVINSPTGIVKGDVGLGNVDNTSDATKNSASATLTNKTLTAPVVNSPTGIVKADVGLGNVDNTSDAAKNSAVSTLTNKTLTAPVVNSPTGIVKGDVGLGNVDNTSDATKNSATVTLTNKTISGSANTFSNIPNTAITGLGTMSTQNANAVAITGGTIDGVTLDGGTF